MSVRSCPLPKTTARPLKGVYGQSCGVRRRSVRLAARLRLPVHAPEGASARQDVRGDEVRGGT